MHFEISRIHMLERYLPYLVIAVFTPLLVGDHLMNRFLITGMLRYYVTLNVLVGVCFIFTIGIIVLMYMKYQQVEENPSVEWLHSMGALEYSTMQDKEILHIQDIVFIDMTSKRKGVRVSIYTDYKEIRFYYTLEGYTYWTDFIDNYLFKYDIPIDYNGSDYYDTNRNKSIQRG